MTSAQDGGERSDSRPFRCTGGKRLHRQEAGWVWEPNGTLCRGEKSFALYGKRNPVVRPVE
jgi:hypothetical protein